MSEPTVEDVAAILDQFDRSEWNELRIDSPNFQLHVYKTPSARRDAALPSPPSSPPAASSSAPAPAVVSRPPASVQQSPAAGAADAPGGIVVRAPNLGTFYRAPKPGAQPFVSVGQVVEPATELCIIEVMKLFTAVHAAVSGTVREILVSDGEVVEYDQPLFVIDPTAS